MKKQVLEAYGHVDILFNNVGILITSALEDIQLSDWNKTFDVNVKATMLMTKEFIDLIIERHGNVLNCASIDGLDCNIRGIWEGKEQSTIW